MKEQNFFLIFIFCWHSAQLLAQPAAKGPLLSPPQADSLAYQTARNAAVILRNTADLLPLKKLNERVMVWRSWGLSGGTFEETLAKYRPASPWPMFFNQNDVAVFGMHADSLSSSMAASRRPPGGRLVLVVFGSPRLPLPPIVEKADAVLFMPDTGDFSQSIAAQIVFGGCAAQGRLTDDLPPYFTKGDGLTTRPTRLGFAPPAVVGLDAPLLEDSIAAIVEEGIRAQAFPGAQVLVAKDGQVVYYKTFGFQTYDSLRAVAPTDLYDFASVTKVTSTLPVLMKLYGEGRFDLDAPLKQYLPFFRKSDKANITYRQLLAHNGRLKPSIVFWKEAQDGHGHWKRRSFRGTYSRRYPIRITDHLFLFKNYRKKIIKGIRDLPLSEKPGYVYSDLSFILYPELVEKMTGQPLDRYLQQAFFGPIGASTLTYNPLSAFQKERIAPTERDTFFRRIQVQGTVHDETAAMLRGVSGHAGLFGSAIDLAKLVQLYLNGGEYGGERFMAEAAVREFTRCQYCGEGNRRGLGFDKPLIRYDPVQSYVARDASPESFGHSGYTGTFFWADPKYNLLVVFFSNRVYPDRSHSALSDLSIRPRVQQVAYDAMKPVQH